MTTPPSSYYKYPSINSPRKSNIELLRIVAMFMILVHHTLHHSGIKEEMAINPMALNTFAISLLGIGGKIGVNLFFIITGYFTVHQNVRISKIAKLILEIVFYDLVVCLLFLITLDDFSLGTYLKSIPATLYYIKDNFIGAWLLVFITSPLANCCLKNLPHKKMKLLLCILLCIFCIPSIIGSWYMYSYFSWGLIMYLVGGYLRLYPNHRKSWLLISSTVVGVIWLWYVYYQTMVNGLARWNFDMGSYPDFIPFVLTAVPIFILFTRIKNFYNPLVNMLGAGAFAVYIIHDVLPGSRRALWQSWVSLPELFSTLYGIPFILIYCMVIYIVGATIDLLRRRYLEQPLFRKLKNRWRWLNYEY